MNVGRILANSVARRIAYVVVAAVLAWLGLGEARAACVLEAAQAYRCSTEGEAYNAAMTYASSNMGSICAAQSGMAVEPTAKKEAGYWQPGAKCQTTYQPYQYLGTWYTSPLYRWNQTCGQKPTETFSHADRIPGGSHGCKGGCDFAVYNNGDGTYTRTYGTTLCNVLPECLPGEYLHVGTSLCMEPEQECAANQSKNSATGECEDTCPAGLKPDAEGLCKPESDTCPPGNIKAPSGQCLPGEGQCAAGEARRPNGTCGRDSDGDGEADEDDEDTENDPDTETASGGDSCNAPPSCSGGAIMCLQAKIQWRIDCNTRSKVDITGGSCAAMPVCVGENCKAMEYAQLLQQWRTTCALEKMKPGDGGQGGDGEKIKPDFEQLVGGGDGSGGNDSIFLPDGDSESFNESLVSYGGGALGWNFSIEGQQFTMPQQIKDWLPAIRWLIIAGATLVGIGIAWGRL